MTVLVRRRSVVALLALLVALLSLVQAAPARADGHAFDVELRDLSGRVAGSATMTELGGGMIEISVTVDGMSPVAGDHFFGATAVGACAPDFAAAGELVATFPPVQFYADGSADYRAEVEGSLDALSDDDGAALVLHADGAAESDRILCGVAVASDSAPAPEPGDDDPTLPPVEDDFEDDFGDEDDFESEPLEPIILEPMTPEERLEDYLEDGSAIFLTDVNGRMVGLGLMYTDEDDTGIELSVSGMEPVAGNHRMAISDAGLCEAPDFSSAGADQYVFDDVVPMNEWGEIEFWTEIESSDVDLGALFDDDGSSLVLYEGDHGNPGGRILCGEILTFREALAELGISLDDLLEDFEAIDLEPDPEEEAAYRAYLEEGAGIFLYDASGRMAGIGTIFTDEEEGYTDIALYVEGMEPVEGDHMMSVTTAAQCEGPDFTSAGDDQYVFEEPVWMYDTGEIDFYSWVESSELDVRDLFDEDGSSLVIYADDHDNPGARILCGTLIPFEQALETLGTTLDEFLAVDEPVEQRSFYEYLEDGAGIFLYDANGRMVGTALMLTDDEGYTDISIFVEDMQPVPGDHMFAVTESGQCDVPDFTSAGDDLYVFDEAAQMFDSGMIDFYTWVDSSELDVRDLFDEDGSALVIYADDHDNPGPRILCGAALPFEDFIESLGITLDDFILFLLFG